jgi:hypothetical protein
MSDKSSSKSRSSRSSQASTNIVKSITSTAGKLRKSPLLKFKYSLYSALAFFLLASPQMFSLVQKIFGSVVSIADANGCPSPIGLVIHTGVFLVLLYIMMSLPRDIN